MNKVFLIGYMGVGKTTIGKRLANLMDIPFIDLDQSIEESNEMSVSKIFSEKGEAYFRQRELEELHHFIKEQDSFILSTGGGTVMIEGAMDLMLKNGIVVWLDLPLKMILDRLKQKKDRPLLEGKKGRELEAFVEAHFAERQGQYARAHIKFDASDLNSEKLHQLHQEIHSR